MQSSKPRIGFIGLGIMGRPMLKNLIDAGYPAVAYTRTAAKLDEAERWGAQRASSPADAARQADVVITMLPDSPDAEAVYLGPGGVAESARTGLTCVDMSTIAPAAARRIGEELARRGAAFMDAPVSGGEPGAVAGALSIMAGGDAATFERLRPIFDALGTNVVHVGDVGMGQTVKLCNQVICALNILAVAEGLALAERSGADLEKTLQVVGKGSAASWMLEHLGPKMAAGDFAPGFMVRLQQKDLRLVLEQAEAVGQPLLGTAVAQQLFRAVEAGGGGEEGTQALFKAVRGLAAAVDEVV